MDNDDVLVGRILSRREAVVLLTGAGAGLVTGCTTGDARAAVQTSDGSTNVATIPSAASPANTAPACVVRPEMTEGPYFLDKQLARSDIRAEPSTGVLRAGAPLVLTFAVTRVTAA